MATADQPPWDLVALRRCALAVSVLYDVDVVAGDDGLHVAGCPELVVDWPTCAAVAGPEVEGHEGRERLAGWLAARRWVADRPEAELAELARPVALPAGHPLHPGRQWPRRRLPGGVLEVGVGLLGLTDPMRADPPPAGVLAHAGYDDARWWEAARRYLERMGQLAVERWHRDPAAPLRPMGDCDALTLLASETFRQGLVAGAPGRMRQVAVPMRSRGWFGLRRTDVAFARTAAALTAAAERGLDRPALVSAEEVAQPPDRGDPAGVALRDPPAPDPWWGRTPLPLDG